MIVYTYYEEILSKKQEEDLIEICKKSWEKNGWKFIVLRENDAKEHPFYSEYKSIIKTFPSINPETYDYHCYIRWLAMSRIGGGIMIDYDVINISLKEDSIFLNQNLSVYQTFIPCVVSGTNKGYLNACKKFCEFIKNENSVVEIDGKKHTSDMIMIKESNNEEDFKKIDYVKHYPEKSPLIHCSYELTKYFKKSKLEIMTKLINESRQQD